MSEYRIILADDHVILRHGIKNIIDGVDDLRVVGEAGDGAELLKMLHHISPDLIIMDTS
ncbi:MAG: response regulator, partial [Desulfobacteraceae bacterium]|nr:response regulator [Desulfobacteraceae bacterium]